MKIEKIEANKVKITLYSDDLRSFNLTRYHIKNNTPELHIFLCEIMKRVQNETNFNPYDGQVLVEAMPFETGLVLMISKTEKQRRTVKKVKSVKLAKKENVQFFICVFEKFSDLCRMFEECGNIIGSGAELYRRKDMYFLIQKSIPERCVYEYAAVHGTNKLEVAYIKEMCVHIADGEKLLKMSEFMSDINNN